MKKRLHTSVLPFYNSYGEISSEYPSMSIIVIGLSLPILIQRWRCLLYDVYWLPDGCCTVGSKYLEYNSSIRAENTLNNRTLDSWTKAPNRTKQWMNKSWTMKTGNKQYMHRMVKRLSKRINCDRPILARVINLWDYGIDNCNPVLLMCKFMRHQ